MKEHQCSILDQKSDFIRGSPCMNKKIWKLQSRVQRYHAMSNFRYHLFIYISWQGHAVTMLVLAACPSSRSCELNLNSPPEGQLLIKHLENLFLWFIISNWHSCSLTDRMMASATWLALLVTERHVWSLRWLVCGGKPSKKPGCEARQEKATCQFPLPSGLAGRKETGRLAPHIYGFGNGIKI